MHNKILNKYIGIYRGVGYRVIKRIIEEYRGVWGVKSSKKKYRGVKKEYRVV